ncbi:hypothetical protein [Streptomyces sp. NPDC060243]|uniref:hypothetical protein n=1 Tax=Streptomyces sp. NPDC060243 TaxID=3347081 RepID=UPI0036587AB2
MAVRYTDEELRGAFAGARTLGEVMERLGVGPENRERRTYLRRRMKAMGLDLDRLEDERGRWTRAELAEAVAASHTMYEVLSRLGIDQVGGWHTHLSRRITKLGIDSTSYGSGGARHARASAGGRQPNSSPSSPTGLAASPGSG